LEFNVPFQHKYSYIRDDPYCLGDQQVEVQGHRIENRL